MAKSQILKAKKEKKTPIPEKYLDVLYCCIIVLLIFIFFGGIITGGHFNASDNIASVSFRTYLADAKASGNYPLWVPHIFSGVPGFASLILTGDRTWDFIANIYYGFNHNMGQLFGNDAVRVIMFYVFFALGMYFLMKSKAHIRAVAMFVAIAAVFSTGIIHWIMIGHNTKPMVFAMLPWIFMFLEKTRVKFSLLYASLLIIALHIFFEATHLQMIFYSLAAISIYLTMELISRIISKREPLGVVRAIVVLIVAAGIAFLMSADRYLSVREYTPYSTRGSAPITQKDDASKTVKSGGHDYDYATMWSFSPQEMFTFFVPNYYGFGKLKYKSHLTGGQETKVPTYWGQKPFEDVAPYMGIFIFFLAIIGFIYNRRDVFVQSLAIISVFVLVLSFGYTFPILYDLFYYYFPNFNKFRAPSMALAIMQFAFPILAGYGLKSIFEWNKNPNKQVPKPVKILLIISGGFLLFGILYAAVLKDSYLTLVANAENTSRYPAEIHQFIYSQMISDWFVTALILIVAVLLIFYFVKNKLSPKFFMLALTFLLVFDLWRVGFRGMEVSDTNIEDEVFRKTDLVDFLQQDKSLYRIADFAFSAPNVPVYFGLQTVGGYHPAKLRVYQDVLDVADRGSTSVVTNPFLWNLLNVKYILVSQDQNLPNMQPVFQSRITGAKAYLNPGMLPRAFFVDSVAKAEPLYILNRMKDGDFEPTVLAFMETDNIPNIEPPTENAKAEITEYQNEYIKINVKTEGNNLLFLGDVYYSPGWQAFLDGKEIPIYKTNYAFRSVAIPPGEHTLEFKFSSETFKLGKTISLICNIFTIVALGLGIFLINRKKKENNKNIVDEKE